DFHVTGVQTCALPICRAEWPRPLYLADHGRAGVDCAHRLTLYARHPATSPAAAPAAARLGRAARIARSRRTRGRGWIAAWLLARSEERRVGKRGSYRW